MALSLIALAACGSSDATSNLDDLVKENVSTGLAPIQNGFAFANYGAAASTEQFNTEDLVTMFGKGACVDGKVDTCSPTAQAAAWARMVNDARQSGHCEGLVVQASARFNEKAVPPTAKLPRDAEVEHGVMRAFATQFLPEVQDSAKEWSNRSLVDIVNELSASLKDGTTDYTMGLYTENGGHAVLPFAIDFTNESMAVIRVYDSNWPGMDRYVVIDFEADEWFFSFSGSDPQQDECAWKGGQGDIDITPLSARTSAICPFCGDKSTVTKSMLLIRSTTNDWSVKTSAGTYSPKSGSDVEGVTAKSIRTATCDVKIKLPEFVIAAESLNLELTLPSDSSAYISNGTSVVEIKTRGKKSRKPILIGKDTITINDSDTTMTVSIDNLAVVVTAPQADIELGSDNISVVVTTDDGKETVKVTPENPRQEVSVENNNVIVSDATAATDATTPAITPILQQNIQSAELPPTEQRDLANAEYAEEVKAAASTTTTLPVPRASSTTSTTKAPTTANGSSDSSSTSSSTTTSTTTTTTTIPTTANIRVVIQNGEGGIRFSIGQTQYPDSWGSPVWYSSADPNGTSPGNCGPSYGSLCNGKIYVVPLGHTFQYDWALYHDNYLFEIQCGSGTPWYNPSITYGSGSEIRSIGRCEIPVVQGATTITFRQR